MINTPICFNCKHFKKSFKCGAFKDGIPNIILTNIHDHTEPYPGDNGIQFEPIEDKKKEA